MSEDALQQAVQLAKSGKHSEATSILKTYVRNHPKDARGWWLIANLVNNPKVKIESLKRVLALNPNHSKAQTMLSSLEPPPPPKSETEPDWLTADIPTNDDPFPSMDSFGFDNINISAPPSASPKTKKTVDEKVIFDNLQRKKQERQLAEQSNKQVDDRTWLYIIGGLVTITAIIIGVLLVFYIRDARGPSLNATIKNSYASINYPNEWRATQPTSNTIIISTSPIDINDINPWGVMHDLETRAYPFWLQYELEYWSNYYSYGFDFEDSADPSELLASALMGGFDYEEIDPDSLMVVVVQALPGRNERGYDAQSIVDAVSTELKGNSYESDFSVYEQTVEVKKSDIEINGQQGTFTQVTISSEFGIFSDGETHSSFYFATVRNGDIEYLFLLSASEEKAGRWEKTAKRMAESIEFFTPADTTSS